MFKKNLIFILWLLSNLAFAQSRYAAIDARSKSVPDTLYTYPDISKHLVQGLSSDKEKARAIYIWVTHNIEYDLALLAHPNIYKNNDEIIEYALKSKSGVCLNYAELFSAMCNAVDLYSRVVSGVTMDYDNSIADESHAWNVVRINEDYYFIDATWAAGYVLNNQYYHEFRDDFFLVRPNVFIKDHIPFDPIWQCLSNPISFSEFEKGEFGKADIPGWFMYRDSISKYNSLDKLARIQSSFWRIKHFGQATNTLTNNYLHENSRQISYLEFNRAVDTLNFGIDNFNEYIVSKNRCFNNLNDDDVRRLFNNALLAFNEAERTLNMLVAYDNDLIKSINKLRKQLPYYSENIKKEEDFLTNYFKLWKPLRPLYCLSPYQ